MMPKSAGLMLLPRVTMQDVAEAAKVHQTTVSLALRNDPRLPEKTRQRIQRIAQQMGYRPDPALAALNFYRYGRRLKKSTITMAFLLNFRDRNELETSAAAYPHRLFLRGAREQAEQIGFRLEVFFLGHNDAVNGSRIERILKARGIVGVILGAFGDAMSRFTIDWTQFSTVLIESQQLNVSLHMVSSNQTTITREAVRQLYDLGYRRIGLAVGEREEDYLKNSFTGGYYVEVAQRPDLARLPPLLLPNGASSTGIADLVTRWTRDNAVQAIISNWPSIPDAIRLGGQQVPGDVVVASLDYNPDDGPNAGMQQNHRVVGARAVEQLAILLRTNQCGLIESPNNTLINGRWVHGTDVPPAPPSKKRPGPAASPARRSPF